MGLGLGLGLEGERAAVVVEHGPQPSWPMQALQVGLRVTATLAAKLS